MPRALVALAAVLTAAAANAEPPEAPVRQFTGRDLFGLQVATDPQIRPDGAVVAYTRVSHDVMTRAAVDLARRRRDGRADADGRGPWLAFDAALVARRQAPRLRLDGGR